MGKPTGEGIAVITVLLLGVAFLLAVVFGAQTEDWSWGPALLFLGFAAVAALGCPTRQIRLGSVSVFLGVAILWILVRALQSPVIDGARSDALLALGLVSCSWITSRLAPSGRGMRWLHTALACVALANIGMAFVQYQHPEFVWPYLNKPSPRPTGFFGHYNYFSNFVGGVGILCLCRAVFVKDVPLLRILFLFAFLGAAVLIPLSGSRGGTITFGMGVFLFLVAAGVLAWRCRSVWTPVLLLILPVLLVGVVVGGWMVFKGVEDRRNPMHQSGSSLGFLDNVSRLQWLELATEVAKEHPVQGGGSRSFSWERNQAWDVNALGRGTENERFVHNELAQTITDYGLVGAVFVVLVIASMMWIAVKQLFLGEKSGDGSSDALAAAIIAAGGMILLHSNFSFVFHLLPSTLLLGTLIGFSICLQASGESRAERPSRWQSAWVMVIVLPLVAFGLAGSLTLRTVWPMLYADPTLLRLSADEQVSALDSAARRWPGYRLAEEQGKIARLEAVRQQVDIAQRNAWNTRAALAFTSAASSHPFHPGFQVNLGNILSDLGRDEEAEEAFESAIQLQGGLESGFRSRLCYAQHLYRRWYGIWQSERRSGEALHEFLRARDLLDKSDEQSLLGYDDSKAIRSSLEKVIEFLEGGRVVPVPPRNR